MQIIRGESSIRRELGAFCAFDMALGCIEKLHFKVGSRSRARADDHEQAMRHNASICLTSNWQDERNLQTREVHAK